VRFVLAGGPPGYPGEELAREWLPEECQPFRERIHFTGWLGLDELAGWYRRAHVQVIPSRYEPFGMVVLEGMLHGLAIVATDIGGPAEILEDGCTALLVPPGNSDALGDALFRVLASRDLRAELGRAAASEVRRNWLWDRISARMLGVYREVLAEKVDLTHISTCFGNLIAPSRAELAELHV
jgi:glycogen(starch) synthase